MNEGNLTNYCKQNPHYYIVFKESLCSRPKKLHQLVRV
jgi:hypothetical protein